MLNARERKKVVFQLRLEGALKAVPTCTCLPTISLLVLASRIHVEGGWRGPQRSNTSTPDCWSLRGKIAGATWPRLGEAATLCSCLLCAAKLCPPAGSAGDLGKPSPPSWVERSRGIPDISRVFVFHPEDSQCSRGWCYKGSPYLFEVHITPAHASTLSEATKNTLWRKKWIKKKKNLWWFY